MKKETKRALLDLMLVTDEHNLLKDDDETSKNYEDRKKQSYYKLVTFIKKYGEVAS